MTVVFSLAAAISLAVSSLTLAVHNNDVADIMLQAYSPETKLYEDKLKILGPLCLEEGKNATYGFVLNSRPKGPVRVTAAIALTRKTSPLVVQVYPSRFTMPPEKWNIPVRMVIRAMHDFVDNESI